MSLPVTISLPGLGGEAGVWITPSSCAFCKWYPLVSWGMSTGFIIKILRTITLSGSSYCKICSNWSSSSSVKSACKWPNALCSLWGNAGVAQSSWLSKLCDVPGVLDLCETSSLSELGGDLQAQFRLCPVPWWLCWLCDRTCPSTHRAGISVAGRFWAKAGKKKWLFLTQLLHCLGPSGAVGREVCGGTLQLPFWLGGRGFILFLPLEERGQKDSKQYSSEKRGCSFYSSAKILYSGNPLQRRAIIEGLALCRPCLTNRNWEAHPVSTLAEPRAGSWLLPQSCGAIPDNRWVQWCCWEWKEWAPDRQLCVEGNDSHSSGSAFVSGCWNVFLVGLGDKLRLWVLMRMLRVSSPVVSHGHLRAG